jgi:ribosomal protein S18 acetylase RimI-like enzyme
VADLEELAHRNFGRSILWMTRVLPAARSVDENGLVAISCSIDFPTFRLALRVSDALEPKAWVDAASDFLFADGTTACVYTRVGVDDDVNALLLERGFIELSSLPEMLCEPPLEARPSPDGYTVRLATTEADAQGYARVAGEAFAHLGMPAELVEQVLSTPGALLTSDVVLSIAERASDGAIVAGAFALMLEIDGDTTGYVAYVSCADDSRGHELGDRVTRMITREAFARGARVVTLEASPYGRNTYARMGYGTLYDYRLLIKA